MVVTLDARLEAALQEQANRNSIPPEDLALDILRAHLLAAMPPEPLDEWERGLLAAARPWGISLPDAAVSSEGLYD